MLRAALDFRRYPSVRRPPSLAVFSSRMHPMILNLETLYKKTPTDTAKLAQLDDYVKAALSAVPDGADVTLTGGAPIWLYLKIAHALHGHARILTYVSPATGPDPVVIFNHNPR